MDMENQLQEIVKKISDLNSEDDVETALAVLKSLRPNTVTTGSAAKEGQTRTGNSTLISPSSPQAVIPWGDYQIDPLTVQTEMEIQKHISARELQTVMSAIHLNIDGVRSEDAGIGSMIALRVPTELTILNVTVLDPGEFRWYKDRIPDTGLDQWLLRDSSTYVYSKKKTETTYRANKAMLRPVIRFTTSLSDPVKAGTEFFIGGESFTTIDDNVAIKTRPIDSRFFSNIAMRESGYEGSGLKRYVDYWIQWLVNKRGKAEPGFPEGNTYTVRPERDIVVDHIRLMRDRDFFSYCGYIPMIHEKWCRVSCALHSDGNWISNKGDTAPSGYPGKYAMRFVIQYRELNGFHAEPGDRIILNGKAFIVFAKGLAITEEGFIGHSDGYMYYDDTRKMEFTAVVNGKKKQYSGLIKDCLWEWLGV